MKFADELGGQYGIEVHRVDERLSSREAEDDLRERRRSGSKTRRVRRGDVDREAARILLLQWLQGPARRSRPMTRPLPQLDANGRLRHLITLDGLDPGLISRICWTARRPAQCPPGQLPPRGDDLRGWTVANLFAEPSTRTRASFELAALRLGADVVNLDVMLSSRVKGESHHRHDLHARGDAGGRVRGPRRRAGHHRVHRARRSAATSA